MGPLPVPTPPATHRVRRPGVLGVSSRVDTLGTRSHQPKLVVSCVVRPVDQTVTEVAASAPGQGTEVPASSLFSVDFGIRSEARSTKRELGGARSVRCAARLPTPERHGLRSGAPVRFHGPGPGFHASFAARSPEGERSEPWRAWMEQVLPSHLQCAPFRRGWANQILLSGRSTGFGSGLGLLAPIVRADSGSTSRTRHALERLGWVSTVETACARRGPVRRSLPAISGPSDCARGCCWSGRRPGGTFNPG